MFQASLETRSTQQLWPCQQRPLTDIWPLCLLSSCIPVACFNSQILFTDPTISLQLDKMSVYGVWKWTVWRKWHAENVGQIGNWIIEPWLKQWSHQSRSRSEIWCYMTIQSYEQSVRRRIWTCHTSGSVKSKFAQSEKSPNNKRDFTK